MGMGETAELLRRSLVGGRLAHAYLFLGDDSEVLVEAAMALASQMNCEAPPERAANGRPLRACGRCSTSPSRNSPTTPSA